MKGKKINKIFIRDIAECVAGMFVKYNPVFATKQDLLMFKKRFEFMLKQPKTRQDVIRLLKKYKQREKDVGIVTQINNLLDWIELLK